MSKAIVAIVGWAIPIAGCRANVGEGGACEADRQCAAGYVCFRGSCIPPKQRDLKLTEDSGADRPTEKPIVGGDRVRVRMTFGEGRIFAQCTSTERLTGGGCKGGDNCASSSGCGFMRSYPGQFTATDTLGGRWYCDGVSGTISAYALCQDTSAATKSSVPASLGSGSGSGSGLRSP